MSISEKDLIDEIRKTVAKVVSVDVEDIGEDTRVGEDLDAESLDYIEFTYALEMKYGVEFYPGSAVEKLTELLAPEPLEENGLLTGFGSKVLQARMPEVEPARLAAGSPTVGIEAYFTPRTFARVVRELLDVRPKVCPVCNDVDLKVAKPSVLKCSACGADIECPNGEHYLEGWVESMDFSFVGK